MDRLHGALDKGVVETTSIFDLGRKSITFAPRYTSV